MEFEFSENYIVHLQDTFQSKHKNSYFIGGKPNRYKPEDRRIDRGSLTTRVKEGTRVI